MAVGSQHLDPDCLPNIIIITEHMGVLVHCHVKLVVCWQW